MSDVAAVILCGGESRRMGRPKAWLPFGDETMLERVVGRVGRAASPIVVVHAAGQELPGLPAEVILTADSAAGRGPLQGLAAGLEALPGDVELVFATATDVPFVAPAWIGRLRDRVGDADLVIPRIDGYLHPLAALYRKRPALEAIRALLEADRLRPAFLLESLRSTVLGPGDFEDVDPGLRTLRNLNTPEDYERALRELERPS